MITEEVNSNETAKEKNSISSTRARERKNETQNAPQNEVQELVSMLRLLLTRFDQLG